MGKLRLFDHAKTDLSDIWFHIAQDNPTAAGPPEQVASVEASYTGPFLRDILRSTR